MQYDVVALGELLVDFTCTALDSDGYPAMSAHPGGAPANFLAALSKYGMKTALIGKVGNDAFGRMLLGTLEKAGIGTEGMITDDEVFTTLAFVTLSSQGDREFSFARKPGADTCLRTEEVRLDLIDSARVLHFGTLSLTDEPARSATYSAVRYARERGKLISYDPNLRMSLWKNGENAKEQMLRGLELADVVKISDEEVEFLFGLDPEKGAEKIMRDYGAGLVYVTCGADGCFYMNGNARGRIEGLKGLAAVDTTGAGDIFGGSAMYKLLGIGKAPEELNDAELREICAFAVRMSGLSVTKAGGIPSIPELSEA